MVKKMQMYQTVQMMVNHTRARDNGLIWFYKQTDFLCANCAMYGYVCAQGQMICQNKLHKEPF
jgi:hypothetical protein